ncbi:MAG: hypothetical protein WC455_20675 [Dehalococcoidia bacterium]|jgi:hypothetical protein
MNDYEKCCKIRRVILKRAGEIMAYSNWGAEFSYRQITELKHHEALEDARGIDPNNLTREQALDLGFGRWEDGNPLLLIPIFLLPFLAETFDYMSFTGERGTTRDNMDNDNRYGCLAYGVVLP